MTVKLIHLQQHFIYKPMFNLLGLICSTVDCQILCLFCSEVCAPNLYYSINTPVRYLG